ncbi:MAG: NUDIX hydrolase [Sulfitobacter sp.]
MRLKSPRLAVRAILKHEGRLLLVNAYPDGQSTLMCAPGGGVEVGTSLPDNLRREVFEETGLNISVGSPCLVNEFHDPASGFHQVDVYFQCTLIGSAEIDPNWQDSEAIVSKWQWVSKAELSGIHHKPDSLSAVAFEGPSGITYDPLEVIVR